VSLLARGAKSSCFTAISAEQQTRHQAGFVVLQQSWLGLNAHAAGGFHISDRQHAYLASTQTH